MPPAVLLTGPEVVGVVRDVVVIAFLFFAFLALAIFVVLALLLYRRLATLLGAMTATLERGDRVLEDIGGIVATVRTGGSIPGALARSAVGVMGGLFRGLLRRRARAGDDHDGE